MAHRPEEFEEIMEILQQTKREHSKAFRQTGGSDPDWPLWYANHLVASDIEEVLDAKLTKSMWVYLLVKIANEHDANAPGAEWSRYFAKYLIDKYV